MILEKRLNNYYYFGFSIDLIKGEQMMIFVVGAFFFGLIIPYSARRFAKFMPATFAGALIEIFRPCRKVKGYRRLPLYKSLVWHSILCGIITAGLTFAAYEHFGSYGFGFTVAYLCIVLLLAEVDYRSYFLPDILTVPLLILGFVAAGLDMGWISAVESAVGAAVGYFLPVLVSLLIVWRKKDAFGGGDIKMLAALGAWLGVEGVLHVCVVAAIMGIAYALARRQKNVAFGPMIALAGIIVAFWLF